MEGWMEGGRHGEAGGEQTKRDGGKERWSGRWREGGGGKYRCMDKSSGMSKPITTFQHLMIIGGNDDNDECKCAGRHGGGDVCLIQHHH